LISRRASHHPGARSWAALQIILLTNAAWLRTGIAVVAFGFVVEKFNLFITELGSTNSELGDMIRLHRFAGPLGHYEGFALMVVGIILILAGCFRFVRNERIIDSPNAAGSLGVRLELTVTAVLVLLIAILIR
jgi:putative membrane protein